MADQLNVQMNGARNISSVIAFACRSHRVYTHIAFTRLRRLTSYLDTHAPIGSKPDVGAVLSRVRVTSAGLVFLLI
jgi:hypothetical protein